MTTALPRLTCADRGAPTRIWIGTPPPDWKPGMRPPCRACGAGAAEPCKGWLRPGEVYRGKVTLRDHAYPVTCSVTLIDGRVYAARWDATKDGWFGLTGSAYSKAVSAAMAHVLGKLGPVQAAARALNAVPMKATQGEINEAVERVLRAASDTIAEETRTP